MTEFGCMKGDSVFELLSTDIGHSSACLCRDPKPVCMSSLTELGVKSSCVAKDFCYCFLEIQNTLTDFFATPDVDFGV